MKFTSLVRGGVAASLAIAGQYPFVLHAEQAPIIVTATRTAETADQSLASVTVITRKAIERQQANTLADVLRGVPGITLSNNGGVGKVTGVFIRGAESDHTLVLIDGVKVGSATSSTFPFQDLPPEQIERIEIVRGPRSSLYGSEAIGGVIQIFTRKGSGPAAVTASAGVGSHSSRKAAGGVSGSTERAWYNVHLAYETTNGYNSCTGKPATPPTFTNGGGCFTSEPDNDGYDNRSVTLGAGYRFANDAELSVNFLRTDGDVEFDGGFQNESDTIQQVAGGKLRFSPLTAWDVTLSVARNKDESNNYLNDVFASRFDTQRDVASWQNDFSIGDTGVLTLGADYQEDKVRSTTRYVESSRDNKAAFGQYQVQLGAQSLLAALRYDDNEQFGGETTGSIAWGYRMGNGLRLMASYGTAFRAPSFNDLYFPGFGNPDLDPEESDSFEVGVSRGEAWGNWSLNAFQTEIDELIAFDPVLFIPVNVDEARIRGLEAVADTRVLGTDIAASLTVMDPENRGNGANKGNLLARRPKRSLRLDIDRRFAALSVGATLVAESKRYDDLANNRKLDSYETVDLRAEYAFYRDWRISGTVNNLLDKDYETAEYYPQDGRNYFVTLHYRPQQ